MMKFARLLFAALVMGLVASALVLATLNWVASRPEEIHFAIETAETPAVELAETDPAALDATLNRP